MVIPIHHLPSSVTLSHQPGLSLLPRPRRPTPAQAAPLAQRRALNPGPEKLLQSHNPARWQQQRGTARVSPSLRSSPEPVSEALAPRRAAGSQDTARLGNSAEGCGGSGAAEGWTGGFSPMGAVHRCKLWLFVNIIFYVELVKCVWGAPSRAAAPFPLWSCGCVHTPAASLWFRFPCSPRLPTQKPLPNASQGLPAPQMPPLPYSPLGCTRLCGAENTQLSTPVDLNTPCPQPEK